FVRGSVAVSESSRLLGAGALYRWDLGMWGEQRINALVGYRYLHSSDRLSIAGTADSLTSVETISSTDAFNASSNFHGVDLGLAGEWKRGPWTLEWRGKVALGANFNHADISGTTTATVFAVTATLPGGLLALSSNIGSYSQTRFAAVPEIAVKAAYQ